MYPYWRLTMVIQEEINWEKSIFKKLEFLYGTQSNLILEDIKALVKKYKHKKKPSKSWVDENDIILITYADSIYENGQLPLKTLKEFLVTYVKDSISAVHILPFYPYSSDDGFSIIDYRQVNPKLGDWWDIKAIGENYDLMFDAVINHVSKSSEWFQNFLAGHEKYNDYFIEADPNGDYSKVSRPRALPLLTPFETVNGKKYLWTTFSEDQIDLNYKNPAVLLEILEILAMYAANDARYIRLDAIGFLWKKKGTTCLNLDETHMVVKIIREVLDKVAPGTILIAEANVPHKENISYFGDGYDEAHMVYQFALPPLTLFSFYTGNAQKLLQWVDNLKQTSEMTTYLNFLPSHDGIGMRPTEGILEEEERDLMLKTTIEHGGLISYKDNGNGTKCPYELNINYLDALTDSKEDDTTRVNRFLAAHGILLSLVGVPGIYIHSLLGSRNYYKGVQESGIYRRINREKLEKNILFAELETNTIRRNIFYGLSRLISIRKKQSAFSPRATQNALFLDSRVFSVLRTNEDTGDQILAMINVCGETVLINTAYSGYELISNRRLENQFVLQPYQIMWVKIS